MRNSWRALRDPEGSAIIRQGLEFDLLRANRQSTGHVRAETCAVCLYRKHLQEPDG